MTLPKKKVFGTSCMLAALLLGVWVSVTTQAQERGGRRGGDRSGRFEEMKRRWQEMNAQPAAPAEAPKTEEKKEEKKDDKAADDAKKKPAVETVKRPDRPPRQANREELELKPDKEGKVRFNFRGQQWTDVLEWYARVANVSLDWQEVPAKTVDLVTQQAYTLDESRDVLNRLLLDRGFTLVRNGEVLSVINLANLNPGILPRVEPADLEKRDEHEFVKVSFQLDTLLAETAAEEFKSLMSTYGKLTPLKTTNRLEAVDAVANLRELSRVVSQEQSTSGQERLLGNFDLKYTRAADVKEKLEALLGVEKKSATPMPMSPEQMQQMQQAQQQRGQRGGAPGADEKKTQIFIVANERDNSVLVSAPADKMAVVKQAVLLLDQPTAKSGYADTLQAMRVYRLAGLDPEALVKTLQTQGNLEPKTHLEVDKTNNAVIAFASLIDHGKIKMMVDTLDGSGRRFKVVRLRRLPADYVAGTLTTMVNGDEDEQSSSRRRRSYGWGGYGGYGSTQQPQKNDKFRATADVQHNKLLLWANEVEFKLVDDFLVELGEIPPREGNQNTVRMIEIAPGDQTEELLKRLKEAWPSFSPNELKIEGAPPKEDKARDKDPKQPSDRDLRTQLNGDEKSQPASKDNDEQQQDKQPQQDGDTVAAAPPDRDAQQSVQPFLRLAQLEAPSETKKDESSKPAEVEAKPDATSPKAGEPESNGKTAEEPQKPAPSDSQPAPAEKEFPPQDRHPLADGEGDKKQPGPGDETPGDGGGDEAQPKRRSPVTITRSPKGGIIIQSDDPRALDLLEELISELSPPQPDFVEFHLKHADAYWISAKLEEYFKADEKKENNLDSWYWGFSQDTKEETPNMLSKRKPLKFIDESDTNTIIVQGGDSEQLQTVKNLIEIWDRPEPKDTQSARKLEAFQVRYSKAKVVAETIKEVYRDLLSDNDKSLQDGNNKDKEKKPSADRIYTYIDTGGGDEKKNPVRFKGLLSVGIDELSNTLLISAPEWLMADVAKMIKHLDDAAMPSSKVQVLQVDRRINSAVLQKKLAEVFGKRAAPATGQPKQAENGEKGAEAPKGESNGQQNGNRGRRISGS